MKKQRKIVDTNVLIVANGLDTHIDLYGQEKCINFLRDIRKNGIFVIDDLFEIIGEYKDNLQYNIAPYGNVILKHILDHQYDSKKILVVKLIRDDISASDIWFQEINVEFKSPLKTDIDDRKFIAVHHATGCECPIVNATDSDWTELKSNMKVLGIHHDLLKIEELLI